jgi:predicted amidophosphoribosyltransferase
VTSSARHRAAPRTLPGAWFALADLVLPRACGGCGVPGTGWCTGCAGLLTAPPTRRVLPGGLVVWSAAPYQDPLRSAVVRWKDRGRADLTRALATGLRRAVTAALDDLGEPAGTALVPMPSSARSRRARGHDPVRDLTRALALALGRRAGRCVDAPHPRVPVLRELSAPRVLPVLRQARPVADQAGLTAPERRQNLAGALAVRAGWRPRLTGRPLLLVDDVVTTGATLLEAQRVLSQAGGRVLGAATLASTPTAGPAAPRSHPK